MMKKQVIYVVIADAGRAKFLEKSNHILVPVLPTHHAVDDISIHQDKNESIPGRVGKGIAIKGLHTYPLHSDWYHIRKKAFAVEIARILHEMVQKYDQLILIAAPMILGCLRQNLSSLVTSKLIHAIDKDLTKASLKEIEEYIQFPLK